MADREGDGPTHPDREGDGPTHPDRTVERERMVRDQLADREVRDPRVLAAFRAVPRELFLPASRAAAAYDDAALPIEAGQTISQPYVVAVMLQALAVRPGDRVLEVGAGSGYAAALLAQVTDRICAIEWHPALADTATRRLRDLGITWVDLRIGDGTRGWPDDGTFDGILVSAGGTAIPPALLAQLAPGGRLVMPVGTRDAQELRLVTRAMEGDALREERLGPVVFVPLRSSNDTL